MSAIRSRRAAFASAMRSGLEDVGVDALVEPVGTPAAGTPFSPSRPPPELANELAEGVAPEEGLPAGEVAGEGVLDAGGVVPAGFEGRFDVVGVSLGEGRFLSILLLVVLEPVVDKPLHVRLLRRGPPPIF
ncbi:hypothetical protein, partial [Tritonibacter sp. SIMBA_163]|uniref:hypothetical protein n=1 Tax=Tritonibacter sp. SIMBA_163 TaxID=3080868 RepID=UPI003980FE15